MRILWLVNTPFPEMVRHLGLAGDYMGCWMPALKEALINFPEFRPGTENHLGIACAIAGISESRRFDFDGVTYFCFPKSRICEYLQSYGKELTDCLGVVEEFNPDLIHVHGTEEFYGLIAGLVDKPVVVSLQGILSALVKVYFGSMGWKDILRSPGIMKSYLIVKRKTKTERRIFRMNRFFIGRTLWDKSHLMSLAGNGEYVYYQSHEVMRKEFSEVEWSLESARPATIACVSSCSAYKGVDCLVEAVSLLSRKIPEVTLSIYGSFPHKGYGAFLRRKVQQLGLQDKVLFCGFKDAGQLAEVLSMVRVLAIASHLENSSNSLQEAMLVGTPVVAPFVGGLFSLAEHDKTCLMFPRGDAAVLAESLEQVLTDDNLVARLSQAARTTAQRINNPEAVADNLLRIYQDVVNRYNHKGREEGQ
ncbi:MAG: glycosyltransferase family 4 protein [bacterium]